MRQDARSRLPAGNQSIPAVFQRAVSLAMSGDYLFAAIETCRPGPGLCGATLFRKPALHNNWQPILTIDPLKPAGSGFPAHAVIQNFTHLGDDAGRLLLPFREETGGRIAWFDHGELRQAGNSGAVPLFRRVLQFSGKMFGYSPGNPGRILVNTDGQGILWEHVQDLQFDLGGSRHLTDIMVFGNHLYVALADMRRGFELWRTAAAGEPPFDWEPVIAAGASRHALNAAVSAWAVTPERLLLGTSALNPGPVQIGNWGPELLSVDPSGKWDLHVGQPRFSPQGLKLPSAPHGPGFGEMKNAEVAHIAWYDGCVYVCSQEGEKGRQQQWGKAQGEYAGRIHLHSSRDLQVWEPVEADIPGSVGAIYAMCVTPDGIVLGHTAAAQGQGAPTPITVIPL